MHAKSPNTILTRFWRSVAGLLLLAAVMLDPAMAARGQDAGGSAGGPTPALAARQATNVAIITIHGPIDEEGFTNDSVMAASVQRRIDLAVRSGADAIVFDIDTPGGGLVATLRISKLIKQCPVQNTAAWIHPHAYSGGAIIALACRTIVVGDVSSFGDAMPVTIGRDGLPHQPPNDALKKLLPPLASDVLDSARRFNHAFGAYVRDEYLCLALFANDVELWYVRNKATGQRLCIDRREFEMLFPGVSPEGPGRLAGAPGTGGPSGAKGEGMPSGSARLASIAGIVSADATQMPSSRPVLSEEGRGEWELIDKVSDGTGAAILEAEDMVHYRLASNAAAGPGSATTFAPINTDADLAAYFQAKHLKRLDKSWSEGLVLFLTNIVVRGVILAVFLLAVFVELMHPGAALPGTIALLALGLFIAPPMLIGMANWWEVAAIVGGIVLLAIEIFVTPGFGLMGVAGLVLLFGGLVATFVPGGSIFPGTHEGQSNLLLGVVTVMLAGATAGFGMFLVARYFGSLPVLNRLVLKDPAVEESDGLLAAMGDETDAAARVGEVGTALTPLRPSGRVLIGDRVLDAVAEFGYIPARARVRVTSATRFRVGVEVVAGAVPPGAANG